MKEHDATEISFKKGYEKAVREIFGEIEDYLMGKGLTFKDWIGLAELKKKYTEGEA